MQMKGEGVTRRLWRDSQLLLWLWVSNSCASWDPAIKWVSVPFVWNPQVLQFLGLFTVPDFLSSLFTYEIFRFKVCRYKQGFIKGNRLHLQMFISACIAVNTSSSRPHPERCHRWVHAVLLSSGPSQGCLLLAQSPKGHSHQHSQHPAMTPVSVSILGSVFGIQFHSSHSLLNLLQENSDPFCWRSCTNGFRTQRSFTFELRSALA